MSAYNGTMKNPPNENTASSTVTTCAPPPSVPRTSAHGLAAQALQVLRLIGRPAITLRMPQRLAQAFEYGVFGVVCGAKQRAQALILGTDPRRLVDGELLLDSEMQIQMQEGIDGPRFRCVVPVDISLGVAEHSLILGVQEHDLQCDALQAGKGLAYLVFAPGIE